MSIFKKDGVFLCETKGHSPVDLIIHSRRLIEKLFTVLIIFSLICIPMVGVNYDLTKYLPDSSPSAQALDIMEDEFTLSRHGARHARRMSRCTRRKNVKDRIADVEGVDMVMWCDLKPTSTVPAPFIDYTDIEDYYKDGKAYMDVIFFGEGSSSRTHKAVQEIEQIVGGPRPGWPVQRCQTPTGPTINAEVARVMVLAGHHHLSDPDAHHNLPGLSLCCSFSVLGTPSSTWPNIIFGEISFLSNAVGAVLQLACSMDYSIFLLHAFTEWNGPTEPNLSRLYNALRSAVSIGASGATTIVGFAAMVLMNFGIGPDMGLVLAKGIALSLVTVLLLMPALILRSQNIVAKTQHRPFVPKQWRSFGEFVYKVRKPILIVVMVLIVPAMSRRAWPISPMAMRRSPTPRHAGL